MSAADHVQMSIELRGTKMLLNAMLRDPVAEYKEMIKELTEEEMNAKISGSRTMLHQAVILGKMDWVQELLGAGANQMVKDGDGKTALQLAKEMLSKHAGEKERKDLLDIMLNRPSVGSVIGSCGSSADVGASIGTRRLILKVEESLKTDFSNISTQLNGMKESHEGMKDNLNALKVSLNDLGNTSKKAVNDVSIELDAVRNSLEGVKAEVNSAMRSLEVMKGEVSTTAEKFKTQIKNVEVKVDAIIPMMISLDRDAVREICVEGVMGKTKVFPSTVEKKSKMRKLYEMMYDWDSILSSILQFIRLQSIDIHVDFDSYDIGGMKPTLRDHDERETKGGDFTAFADFEERKAYVGGKWNSDKDIIYRLALVLSQLCVLLAFGNKGFPYSEDGERERELYKGFLEEAERKMRDGEALDYWIKYYALDYNTTPVGKEIYLHAMVPLIIAYHGSSEGRSTLKRQLPSLLEYFEDYVVIALGENKQW